MTLRLRTLLGDHPGTLALKDRSLTSDLVAFAFAVYSPTTRASSRWSASRPSTSRRWRFTYLMAKSFGKPMVLLPSVVVARHQYAQTMHDRDGAGRQ